MAVEAVIESGFATVGEGKFLFGKGQPVAEADGRAYCSSSSRPFLTRLDLGEKVAVVIDKLLIAPLSSKKKRRLIRIVPFSFKNAIPVYELEIGWAIMATSSRVKKLVVEDGGTLSVRPDAVVAWTGNRPTGFCPRLRLRDLLLPRKARLMLNFHGPAIVWLEGARD